MAKAVHRVVEDAAEHIHRSFQAEFGFSMTVQELLDLQRAIEKVLKSAIKAAKEEDK